MASLEKAQILTEYSKAKRSPIPRVIIWVACVVVLSATTQFLAPESLKPFSFVGSDALSSSTWPWTPPPRCEPPSPNIFAHQPPRPNNDLIIKASNELDKYLTDRATKPDIDSIAVALVTANGALFEGGYGVLKANETDLECRKPVDRDSIYRIASITKMFTVLETLILRERGALNWDDPVEKYLPEFSPPSYGWADYLNGVQSAEEKPRITLRQLASHLAGIVRDYPPIDIGDWPIDELPTEQVNCSVPEHPEHTLDGIMEELSELPLVNTPYKYPIYSNTGIDLLGLSNIAANHLASAHPTDEPQTHKELVKRDIFDPLQLNSSFYRVPNSDLKEHIAVPNINAEWADISLGDIGDASGGQYSSLGDLVTLMKTFLSPTARGGVIPAHVVREWLRPLHVWGTGPQQVGAPWEILPLSGAVAYTKGGNLPGYHSEFALIPEYSVGIVLLVTGTNQDTGSILQEIAKRVVPALQKVHEMEVRRRYVDTWVNGEDVAEVGMDNGALYLKKLVIRGVDVLKFVQSLEYGGLVGGPAPIALWNTGRVGEFRLAIGRPEMNKSPTAGCLPYWVTIDPGVYSRGAPLDLIYWKNGILSYPSAGLSFSRKR